MVRILMTLVLMALTSSCIMRAHYHRPQICVPDKWRVDSNEAETIANVNWWQQFDDPVLDQLIALALENNQELGVAVGRVYEFRALLGIARSRQFPEINGNASATRQRIPFDVPQIFPSNSRIFNLFTALLNFTYYLDIWGTVQNQVDAATSDLISTVEARRSAVLTVVSQVAATYVLLRQYDKQLEIALDTYHSRQYSYEIFKLRYEGGINSELEMKQAEAEALDALTQVKRFQILIPQTENLLSTLIGFNPSSIQRGLLLENFHLPPTIPVGLPSELLQQRPDILQAENELIATNSRVAEAKTNFFPQIDLTGNYGNQSRSLKDLFTGSSQTWAVGANVFQQIFNAGRISYELDVVDARRMQALYRYYATVQKAFKEVNDTLVEHEISIELMRVLEKEVKVLKTYLYLANLQYENGQTDYLNVLDAERKLFDAQLQLVQTQADTFNSLIALYAAVGGGWVVEADAEVARPLPDLKELRCYDILEK